jgi:hypothetical protein
MVFLAPGLVASPNHQNIKNLRLRAWSAPSNANDNIDAGYVLALRFAMWAEAAFRALLLLLLLPTSPRHHSAPLPFCLRPSWAFAMVFG